VSVNESNYLCSFSHLQRLASAVFDLFELVFAIYFLTCNTGGFPWGQNFHFLLKYEIYLYYSNGMFKTYTNKANETINC
jgi:hypothetical protein